MKPVFIIVLSVLSMGYAQAQSIAYYNPGGVAIKGYDPVAYFVDNAAVEGSKEFSYSWQGTEWHFKNQANLQSFKADPEKYAPQFGGYCAYGASQNHKSPTEPAAFTIVNGKLYLNYNQKVKTLWTKDTQGNIQKAEDNWITLKDKKD